MSNKDKGSFGEKVASRYLIKRGYKIIERNWTCHWGELDLICRFGRSLVFIEVKYRTKTDFGYGHESLTYRKLKSLRRSSHFYLQKNGFYNLPRKFEAIIVGKKGTKLTVKHYLLDI